MTRARTSMHIAVDDLRGGDIAALLQAHLDEMFLHSPAESVHALDLDTLRRPEITFWTVRDDAGALMGCGALRQLDPTHAEIKSMRTARAHLRKGVAAHLLAHLLEVAGQRGYRRLSLETGSPDAFAPARALYARFGFVPCGPFEGYAEDPYSVFMTLALGASGSASPAPAAAPVPHVPPAADARGTLHAWPDPAPL